MALPLAVLYNIAHHAKYQRGQRSLTERADDGHYQNPPEAHRVYHNEGMGDNNYDTAGERQVALVEFLQQHRTQQRTNDQCDDLGGVNDAVIPFIVAENIFAVVRQVGADDGGMNAGDNPQNERCPEIRVAKQRFNRAGSGNLGLLLCGGFKINGFLAANKADDEQNKCDGAPDAHGLDPGGLIVAEQLDNRHGEGYGNDLADRRQCHTHNGQQVALVRGAGHHGGQGAVGHVDCGVAYGGAQVISNKNVPELNHCAAVRHTEHRNRAQNIRYAHP